jgi:hypothetical protein
MRWRPSRIRPEQARIGVRTLGVAILVVGVAVLSVGTASGAAPAKQEETDPITLFSTMMPVFTSPRCVNCHGGVQPATGENHEGGKVDVAFDSNGDMETGTPQAIACLECHTAADKWRTAPRVLSFVNKDAKAMCRQLKRLNNLSDANQEAKDAFIFHLGEDYFVGLAFAGQRAIGDDSPFGPLAPAPPPMSQADFVGAAQTWLTAGHALCGLGWSGTISVTKTASYHAITQGDTVELDSALDVKDAIQIDEGEATGTVHLAQHDYQDSGPKNHNCGINHEIWAVDGGGPADVQIFVSDPGASASGLSEVQMFIGVPAATGTLHKDMKTGQLTACRQILLTDEPFTTFQDRFSVRGPADANDPNNLEGEDVQLSPDKTITTTIKWKLSRGG